MKGCQRDKYLTTASLATNSQIQFVEGKLGSRARELIPGDNLVLVVRKKRPPDKGTRDTGSSRELVLEITPAALQDACIDVSKSCPRSLYWQASMKVTYQSKMCTGTLKLTRPDGGDPSPHGQLNLTFVDPEADYGAEGSIHVDWEF